MRKPSKKVQNMLWIGLGLLVVAGIAVGIYFAVKGRSVIPSPPSPNTPPSGGSGTIVGPVKPPSNNVKEIQIDFSKPIQNNYASQTTSEVTSFVADFMTPLINQPIIPILALGTNSNINLFVTMVLNNKIYDVYLSTINKANVPFTVESSVIQENWTYISSNITKSSISLPNTNYSILNTKIGTLPNLNSTKLIRIILSNISNVGRPYTVVYIQDSPSTYLYIPGLTTIGGSDIFSIYPSSYIIPNIGPHSAGNPFLTQSGQTLVTIDPTETENFISYALSQPLN
jgi:hypothetical protein